MHIERVMDEICSKCVAVMHVDVEQDAAAALWQIRCKWHT